MRQHPDARRRPLPSAKAGRLALRELGMTRSARRAGRENASDTAYMHIGDAVADAYHLADDYGFPPEGLNALHETRISAAPFPTGLRDREIDLVCFFGNVLHLGSVAYDFCPEALIEKGRDHFDAERHDL